MVHTHDKVSDSFGRALAVLREVDVGDISHLDAGQQDTGLLFEAADVHRAELQPVLSDRPVRH